MRTSLGAGMALAFSLLAAGPAAGQTSDSPNAPPASRDLGSPSVPTLLSREAGRYLSDAIGILESPLHWRGAEWSRATFFLTAIGAVALDDQRLDNSFERRRSARTDAVAKAVTPFGSYAGLAISAASVGGGLIFHDGAMRDTGRDALEAVFLAAGVVSPVVKTLVGRTRPSEGGDADEYHVLSRAQSFPSGHTTEAFAVASVFAARSDGWVVPTLAYGLAAGVALARVNDRAHFPSDVLAGAVLGTTIGRSIVHRHQDSERDTRWDIVPVPARRGAGLGIRFSIGAAHHGLS